MSRARPVRVAAGVVLWLVAVTAATTVGLFAVGAIGTDIFGAGVRQPLSQSEVDRQLASSAAPATTTPPRAPSPGPTVSAPPPATRTTTVHSAGGTVWARCVSGGVEVVGASPAQGFAVDSANEGVDDHPHLRFRSGEREIEVRLRCAGGTVRPEIRQK